MELKQLIYFVTASECKTTSRAAEQLYTSQPNVTRVIHALEEEIGQALFERTPRGIRLTEKGRQVYYHAVDIINRVEALNHMEEQKNISKIFISAFQSSILSNIMVNFYQTNPDIIIEERQGTVEEVTANVEQGISEIGIIYYPRERVQLFRNYLHSKNLEVVEISVKPTYVYVGENSPYYERNSITIEELKDLDLITGFDDFFSMGHKNERAESGILNLELNHAKIFTNSDHLRLDMIKNTDLAELGIGTINPGEVQNGVKCLEIAGESLEFIVGYVKEKNRILSENVMELISLVEEKLNGYTKS